MAGLLEKTSHTASNKRLAKHLRQQRDYLFTFLHCPGLEGTNCRAERAIRPAVIAWKVWGGNRTWSGAHVQQILMSGLRTFHQQGKDAFASLVELLRLPGHKILEIVPTLAYGTGAGKRTHTWPAALARSGRLSLHHRRSSQCSLR